MLPHTRTITAPITDQPQPASFASVSRSFTQLTANIQKTIHAASGVQGMRTWKSDASNSQSEYPN